jgi:glycosyltransferase involved in cell wall biosynthesis
VSAAPLVSVVVRSMDRDHLRRALVSIAAQDVESAEVVVVNAAGRHRGLVPSCGRFPMRLVSTGSGLRRGEAANVGLDAAAGELVYFLDDDDEALPGAISALAGAMLANPPSRLAHGRCQVVDAQGQVMHYFGSPFRPEMRLSCGFFGLGAFVMGRELARKARFDPNLDILEDLDFFAQLSDLTPFTFIDRPVQRYWSDAGTSGAGVGANEDPLKIQRALAYIHRKWKHDPGSRA